MKDMKERVIKILMERDGLDRDEAISLMLDTQEQIDDALARDAYFEVEDILAYNLCLEMDYIWAFV